MAEQRQKIIASLFSRRNASGNLEETYVSHVKIWEDAEGGRKPRYILLSRRLQYIFLCAMNINWVLEASNGSGFIHKSKLNTNGTFSIGKTWKLAELRAINVISVCAPHCILAPMIHCAGSDSLQLLILPFQEHIDGKRKIKKTN